MTMRIHSSWVQAALVVAGVAGTLGAGASRPAAAAAPTAGECVIIDALSGPAPWISDAAECARATAPASTFKIPHALIALQAGVITATTSLPWDGTAYDAAPWRRAHTVDSALRWSALPFFQQTARRIGRERMRDGLAALGYAADDFTGDIASFWLNGDLVVTPIEQAAFLQRFSTSRLPIDRGHLDTVRAALVMPDGVVTNASGEHPFVLAWPRPVTVRLKTGNTTVDGERVSWAVGSVASGEREYVVVARVRVRGPLDGTAGLAAARRALDAFPGRSGR